jgi:regulator of nucleoside diphosphate kinase
MIAQHATIRDELLITEADFDRLRHLVESPRYRVSHALLIPMLREGLGRCRVVEPARVPRGVVTMHSVVTVRDLKAGEPETYTLVFPDDADIDAGKLSVLAPLGAALLGARAGQTIEFATPGGRRRLKVERVLYQPEAAGDFHL